MALYALLSIIAKKSLLGWQLRRVPSTPLNILLVGTQGAGGGATDLVGGLMAADDISAMPTPEAMGEARWRHAGRSWREGRMGEKAEGGEGAEELTLF